MLYTCNTFGKKSNQCRYRLNNCQINFVCYSCNNIGHISKFCRSKKGGNTNSVKENEPMNKIDPIEVNKEIEMIWRIKE